MDQQGRSAGQPVSVPPFLSTWAVLRAVVALEPALYCWRQFPWVSSAPLQEAVVITCLTAEALSNLGNLISPKFCIDDCFKVYNVNISLPFLDFL